jgi:hypothetical protein
MVGPLAFPANPALLERNSVFATIDIEPKKLLSRPAGASASRIGAELANLSALCGNEPHQIAEAAKSLAALVHKHRAQIHSQAQGSITCHAHSCLQR